MTLRLTPRQYKTLLKMVWLSRKVAQGAELPDSETVGAILDLSEEIYSQAENFNAQDVFARFANPESRRNSMHPLEGEGAKKSSWVEAADILDDGPWRFRPDMETELYNILDWFEEFSFWDNLEDRLTMRDIADARTEDQWNWMPDSEKDRIYSQIHEFYYEEFSDNGIQNLRLLPPDQARELPPSLWSAAGADPKRENARGRAERSEKTDRGDRSDRGSKIIEFPGGLKSAKRSKPSDTTPPESED